MDEREPERRDRERRDPGARPLGDVGEEERDHGRDEQLPAERRRQRERGVRAAASGGEREHRDLDEEHREPAPRRPEDRLPGLPGDEERRRHEHGRLVQHDPLRVDAAELGDEREERVPERERVPGVEPAVPELVDGAQREPAEVEQLPHAREVEVVVAAGQVARSATRARSRRRAPATRHRDRSRAILEGQTPPGVCPLQDRPTSGSAPRRPRAAPARARGTSGRRRRPSSRRRARRAPRRGRPRSPAPAAPARRARPAGAGTPSPRRAGPRARPRSPAAAARCRAPAARGAPTERGGSQRARRRRGTSARARRGNTSPRRRSATSSSRRARVASRGPRCFANQRTRSADVLARTSARRGVAPPTWISSASGTNQIVQPASWKR